MKEDFISYLWKYRLLRAKPQPMLCVKGEPVEILFPGQENMHAGPDFLAARVRVGGTLWAGNVEIHVRSSSWFTHGHHEDHAYNNIILHVVYVYDKEVLNQQGEPIPHLEVKSYFDPCLQQNYHLLLGSRSWIPCENLINQVAPFVFKHWLSRLLVCRLERKTKEVVQYLQYFNHHWEQLLLFMLCRYLGGKANATAFGLLVQRTPYQILARNYDQLLVLEALLFGQAGLLEKDFSEQYPRLLQSEYLYLKKKYPLPDSLRADLWKYARMRPANFPDVRIAQLAMIIHLSQGQLFNRILGIKEASTYAGLLTVSPSSYWSTHYRLDKQAGSLEKTLGQKTVNTILINTLAPVLFVYGKEKNNTEMTEHVIQLLMSLPPEQNQIIKRWKQIADPPDCAAESQGLLELYKYYCIPKKCLKCVSGHVILRKNTLQGD